MQLLNVSQNGICLQIHPPYDCKRVCEDIQLGGGNKIGDPGDGKQRNLVLVSGVCFYLQEASLRVSNKKLEVHFLKSRQLMSIKFLRLAKKCYKRHNKVT